MKVLEASKSFVAFASTCNVSGQHARTHCLPSTPVPNKKRAADGLMSRIIEAKLFWTHSNPLLPWKDFAKNCLEAIKEYKRGLKEGIDVFPTSAALCQESPRQCRWCLEWPWLQDLSRWTSRAHLVEDADPSWSAIFCHYPATALRMNGQQWYEVITFTFSTQSRSQGLKIWHGLEAQICSIMWCNRMCNIYISVRVLFFLCGEASHA